MSTTMLISGEGSRSGAVQADVIFITLFAFQHPNPIYARLVHFKVLVVAVTSPHDVYNAFCPSSTKTGMQPLLTQPETRNLLPAAKPAGL